MSEKDNKAIIRRFRLEVFGEGNWNIIDAIFPSRYVINSNEYNPESLRKLLVSWREAFPDLQFTIEDLIAEEDKVAERYIGRGTHKGDFFGISPTGNQVSFKGTYIHRLAHGHIMETWGNHDGLTLMEQLGLRLSITDNEKSKY